MKNAFTKTFLLLAIIAFCLILSKPGGAQSNGQVTTAILTITNITTNGATISINGHVRTWTNIVTSANNQISVTNGTNATATNLLQSFQIYPEAQVFVTPLSSNSFQLQSYPGYSLTIATNTQFTNWISWVFTTNSITNETVVRVPPSSLGTVEQSNVETGIVQWLNLQWATNAVIATNTIWSNFISGTSLAALSNYVGLVATNGTNFAQLVGQSTTNYASNQFVFATNYANTNWTPWSNIVFSALTWTTNTFNTLLKNVSYHDLGNVVGHGTNSILLTNTGPVNRIYMEDFAGALGGYSIFYRSDGSTIWIDDNVSVFGTTIRDVNNVGRIEVGDGGDHCKY